MQLNYRIYKESSSICHVLCLYNYQAIQSITGLTTGGRTGSCVPFTTSKLYLRRKVTSSTVESEKKSNH